MEKPALWRMSSMCLRTCLAHKQYSTCSVCQAPAGKPAAGEASEQAHSNGPLHRECWSVQAGAGRAAGCDGHYPGKLQYGCPNNFLGVCRDPDTVLCCQAAVGKAASAKAAEKAPAQAAGASTLARCLCDPPLGRPMGPTRRGEAAGALTLARCLCNPPGGALWGPHRGVRAHVRGACE